MTRRRRRPQKDEQTPVGLSGWLYTDLLLGLMVVFLATVSVMNLSSDEDEEDSIGGPGTTTTTTTPTPTAEDLADRIAEAEAEVAELRALVETLTSQRDVAQAKNAELNIEIGEADSEKLGLQETERNLRADLAESRAAPRGVEKGFYCIRLDVGLSPDWVQVKQDLQTVLDEKELSSRQAGIVLTSAVAPTPDGSGARRFNREVIVNSEFPIFTDVALLADWNGTEGPGKPNASIRLRVFLMADADHEPLDQTNQPSC